ncbi:MAG: LOG family protein, partial [Lysobacterales bacterium]
TNGYYDRLADFLDNAVLERFMAERHRDMWLLVDHPEDVIQALHDAPAWSADARKFAAVRE